jgi:hypothetical protein
MTNLTGCGIYFIKNHATGKIYVGQSIQISQRIQQHLSALKNRKHSNSRLQRDWDAYGEEWFEIGVLEHLQAIEELLDRRENEWMHHFDSLNPECGYNQTPNHQTNPLEAIPCETFTIKEWTVHRRLSDGYWCASSLCDQSGKRVGNWVRLPETQQFDYLIKAGCNGTWIHPDLAITLTSWISPRLYFGFMQYVRSALQ